MISALSDNNPIIADSSGIIYLHRENLFEKLLSCVTCFTTESVKTELLKKPDGIENYFTQEKICLLPDTNLDIYAAKMSKTDRGILAAALTTGYSVLSDDREICIFCDENDIKFFNSLTAVVLMHEKQIIELNEAYEAIYNLSKAGRYTRQIIRYAFSLLP